MNNDEKNILGKISGFFIERYRVVYLIIAAIMLLGLQAYISLPREDKPEIVLPFAMVTVSYSGAAPQEVETLITDKIEAKLKEIDGIESISSTSSNGLSSTSVEFEVGTDIDEKVNEMRNKVSEIQKDLPDDSNTPIINGFETSDMPIMILNISGDYDLITLKNIGEDIQDEIEKIKGVSEVDLIGGSEREIVIYVEPAKLATYNLSINQIKNSIANSNINAPGGDIELDDMEFNIRTVAELEEVNELEDIIVTVQNGAPIYLKDIARVEDTYSEITSYSQMYEKGISKEKTATPTITMSIKRDNNGDTIGICNEIKEMVNTGKGNLYPDDLLISIARDSSIEVDEKLSDVTSNAISGLFIVIVVLFLFIGFRESIIVAFVIPLSLFASFGLMQYKGMTFNSMSLVALILALGMLVDNAIVIMENIDRIRDEGLDVLNASKIATNQVAPAVLAATLTTMSAFLPMAITSGMMGEFLKVIPITVMFAIGASFVMSLVITPALCARFLSKHKKKNNSNNSKLVRFKKIISVVFIFVLTLYAFMENGKFGLLSWACAVIFSGAMFIKQFKFTDSSNGDLKVINKYVKLMDKILKSKIKRIGLIGISMIIFISSLLTIPLGILKIELFPTNDTTSFTINVEIPSGYLLGDTGDVVSKVENNLFNYTEIDNFVSKVGNNGVNTAEISVELVPLEERERSSMEIIENIRNDLKEVAGAMITVGQKSMGPSSGKPVNVQLTGDNLDELEATAYDFEAILKKIPGTTEVSTSLGDRPPELRVIIDKEKAALLGLDPITIASEIRNVIHGIDVSTFKQNQEEIEILIKTNEQEVKTISDFEKIYFSSPTGDKVAFSRVASLVETKGYNAIKHEELKRIIEVKSNLTKGANSNVVVREFKKAIKDYSLPSDIEISYGGEAKDIQESFGDMFKNMIIAILLVFIILAIQFNSLSQPMIILFSVPLATIGAMIGLIITGNNFGLFAFMGIVALVGIAVNDAIVLVDYTNYLRKHGESMLDAIKEAGKTRFLPVLATSITTIGGILPLALKNPDYGQMGFALIFGLVASTVLTLIIIPILYSLTEEFKGWFQKRVPVFVDKK